MAVSKDPGPSAPGRKSELRRSPRFRVDDTAAALYTQGWLSALGIGRTPRAHAAIKLSEGGILVRTPSRFTSGTQVKVRLEIEKFKDVIEAEGGVRWCFQSAGKDAPYFAGIRFTQVAGPDATKIGRLRGYFLPPECRQRTASRRRRDEFGLQV